MRYNKFDVIELKNGNKAIIINKNNRNQYIAKIINSNGVTIEKKAIKDKEIIDIKFSVSASVFSSEQIYCFSCMIVYYE